jgi:hypothetical protein
MVFAADITAKHGLQLNRFKSWDMIPDMDFDMVAAACFGREH